MEWKNLTNSLSNHPTPLLKIIETVPTFLGASDNSKQGMGDVWIGIHPHTNQLQYYLWHKAFPTDIQDVMVTSDVQDVMETSDMPTGCLTNSTLKLAGTIANNIALLSHLPLPKASIHMSCNNVPTILWLQCGSITSTSPEASLLMPADGRCRTL